MMISRSQEPKNQGCVTRAERARERASRDRRDLMDRRNAGVENSYSVALRDMAVCDSAFLGRSRSRSCSRLLLLFYGIARFHVTRWHFKGST